MEDDKFRAALDRALRLRYSPSLLGLSASLERMSARLQELKQLWAQHEAKYPEK